MMFRKQVKLKLASGDGPVYITGTHSQEIEDMEEESDGMSIEYDTIPNCKMQNCTSLKVFFPDYLREILLDKKFSLTRIFF